MYIYHALINALSAHMIHVNLNMIFYTHVEHCPTKTIDIKYYNFLIKKCSTNTQTHTHTDCSRNWVLILGYWSHYVLKKRHLSFKLLDVLGLFLRLLMPVCLLSDGQSRHCVCGWGGGWAAQVCDAQQNQGRQHCCQVPCCLFNWEPGLSLPLPCSYDEM